MSTAHQEPEETEVIEKRQFYIDGSWVEPQERNNLDVIDPSTEEPCAVISLASAADFDSAVATAKRVFAD